MTIGQLPAGATFHLSDLVAIETDGRTYSGTLQQLFELLYPIGLEHGGTGATDAAGAVANLGLTTDSAANYCKMPDGTLICWGSAINSGGYISVPFPVAFTNAPVFIATPKYTSEYPKLDYRTIAQATTNVSGVINFKQLDSTVSYTDNAVSDWIAIGRWK